MFFPHQFAKLIEWLTPIHTINEHHYGIEKFRSIGPVEHTIGLQLDTLLQDCKLLHRVVKNYIFAIIDRLDKDGKLMENPVTDAQLADIYQALKQDIDLVYGYLLPLQQSRLTTNDVSRLKKIENTLIYITDTATSFENIAQNIRDLHQSKQGYMLELYENISTQIEHLIQENIPSPSLEEIQKIFITAIQK
jgi:hypothetical protein